MRFPPGSICFSVVALLSFAASAEPAPTIDGFRGIWYMNQPQNDEYRYKYSGGFATYPQQHIPMAIHRPEVKKTFFVYGAAGENRREIRNCISYYDHETKQVARPRVILTRRTNDAHYNPTLSIDAAGHVYVFCNSHGRGAELKQDDPTFGKSFIYRSSNPYEIDGFEVVYEGNFSYSQPWPYGNGILWLHTRYAGNVRRIFCSATHDGRTWSEPRQMTAIVNGSYQISWAEENRVATAIDYHPKAGGLNARTNIYYLETRDMGKTWRTVQGEPVELPLTEVENPALVSNYEEEGLLVYLKDLAFDRKGQPVILFLTSRSYQPGPAGGARVWRTARWTGEQWTIHEVTTSDHNYDHGSLYIEDQRWRIIAPTEPGPQPESTGGGIAVWESDDEGKTWRKLWSVGAFGGRNQTYVRRPANASDDFLAFWADGDALQPSESDLYFLNARGEVYRLPRNIDGDFATPQRAEQELPRD